MRVLAGDEAEVLFSPGDEFEGVTSEWLVPRLRLDPAASPVDAEMGLHVVLEDEHLEDLGNEWSIFGTSNGHASLASFGNGDIIGGSIDLSGDWVEFFAPEIEHVYLWVGPVDDLRRLVYSELPSAASYWEPTEDQLFEVESPHLDADNPEDRAFILDLAGEAGEVTLNGTGLRP